MTIVTLLLAEMRICFHLNNAKNQSLSFDEKTYNVNVLHTKSKVTIVTLLWAVFSKLRLAKLRGQSKVTSVTLILVWQRSQIVYSKANFDLKLPL